MFKQLKDAHSKAYVSESKVESLFYSDYHSHSRIMVELSHEQQAIVSALQTPTHSVFVDAVAGSGKTTTVLGIAKANPDKQIVQLTYNRFLRFEVKKRVEAEHHTNLDVHTYHSLFVKYYSKKAYTDGALQQILRERREPQRKIKPFQILVIDEAQDMTPVYFSMLHKFLRDSKCTPQLVFLGDQYQAIYEFKGADARFLTLVQECWPSYSIRCLPLHTSYRLTKPMADFLNEAILGIHRIDAPKPGPPVEYIRENLFDGSLVYSLLKESLATKQCTPEDIFILGPSVRSKSGSTLPIQYLENKLVKDGIPCYVAGDTEEDIDEQITKGKVVFSTFHQAKGRERPIVVVYGFDASWYDYYGKGLDRTVCSNELYVALTRASKRLLLVESLPKVDEHTKQVQTATIPCLQMSIQTLQTKPYVRFKGNWNTTKSDNSKCKVHEQSKKTSVTELTKFISEDYLDSLNQIRERIFTQNCPPLFESKIPAVVENRFGLQESVADLNGIAIPLLWDASRHAGHSRLQQSMMQNIASYSTLVRENLLKLPPLCKTPADFLALANCWQTATTNFTFKLAQLESYTWLSESMIEQSIFILDSNVDTKPQVEVQFESFEYMLKGFGKIEIHAIVDALDTHTLWEFKCVSELSLEHFLQLVLYAWIWKHQYAETKGQRLFKLLNIRTGECYTLDSNSYWIDEVAQTLLQNKYVRKCKIPTPQFIEWCQSHTSQPAHDSSPSSTASTSTDESESDSTTTPYVEPVLNLNRPVEVLDTQDPTLDFELYTLDELVEQCRLRRLVNLSGLTKSELLTLMRNYDKGKPQFHHMSSLQLRSLAAEKGFQHVSTKSKVELRTLLESALSSSAE